MKRSKAPSNLIKRLKTEDGSAIEIDVENPLGAMQWFDRYKSGKGDDEEKENEEVLDEIDGKNTVKGKNEPMSQDSRPIPFAVYWQFSNGKQYVDTGRSKRSKNDNKPKEKGSIINDGLILLAYDNVTLYDDKGKAISQTSITRKDDDEHKIFIKRTEVYFSVGQKISIGNKRIEIIDRVPEDLFSSGNYWLQSPKERAKIIEKAKAVKKTFKLNAACKPKGFQVPLKGLKKDKKRMKPLHNPNSPNAVILFEPKDLSSENKIHVVVDPILGEKLRPHQKEGVKFLFDCAGMGFEDPVTKKKYYGCILADEMGLGKSIQAITLIWTLLRQSPTGIPFCQRALIVCPSSLVGNWANELEKWLPEKLKIITISESKKATSKIGLFEKENDVMVISYDQLKIHIKDLRTVRNLDLVICDEGHRLKNNKIKTSEAVSSLPAKRRVILSGTPIQNDLQEFFAMVDFVNPGFLGDEKRFYHIFADTIMKSREVGCSQKEKEEGDERSRVLTQKTERFILRRTQVINRKYLPPKVEHTVFCSLTPLQRTLYNKLCSIYKEKLEHEKIDALPLITNLKKLCNSPELLYVLCDKESKSKSARDEPSFMIPPSLKQIFPENFALGRDIAKWSGKITFLERLISQVQKKKEKIVVISNYTETLSVLASLCKSKNYSFFQLDGQTAVKKRQQLVDEFNLPTAPEFIFLLSSKAGGVGLNLVGANHLVLFDPDWNPANDEQAMARVWRPGQKKICYLYRTLATGTIEEKVYQRQVTKKALSKSIVEGDVEAKPSFTSSELRDIFRLREDTISDTHDLLNCRCTLSAVKIPRHKRMALSVDDLNSWEHVDSPEKIKDEGLKEAAKDVATFIFSKETGEVYKDETDIKQLEKLFSIIYS